MPGAITGLFVYPVKSLRGIEVPSFELTARGPRFDRWWMLVDATGTFITQRTLPRLAQLVPSLNDELLSIHALDAEPLRVRFDADAGRREVTVWGDEVSAIDCGDEAAHWFSVQLGTACRLVRVADDSPRRLDPQYVRDASAETGFSDGYPLLIANEASLSDLNARLSEPVPMNRFRPNVVVQGPPAWAEDGWTQVTLGPAAFDAVKPCGRCVVITTDQLSGERPGGPEPLKTLASYRTMPGAGAIFGMNLVPHSGPGTLGTIRVGDSLSAVNDARV